MLNFNLNPQAKEVVEAFIYLASLPKEERDEILQAANPCPPVNTTMIDNAYASFLTGEAYAEATLRQTAALRGLTGPVSGIYLPESSLN